MDKKQIKAIVTKRLRFPVVVLVPFNTIGLTFFNQLGSSGFMQFNASLAFTAINAMLIIALVANFVSNVLCDINELNKQISKDQI